MLAGAEFLEIVRRGHACGVEEVLVLAQPPLACLGWFTFGRDAVDRGLALVHRDRAHNANLGAELVHQVHVRVEAQVARLAQHPVGAGFAKLLDPLLALAPQRPVFGVGPVGPQQDVAVLEGVGAAALLGPLAGVHGLDRVDLAVCTAPAGGGGVVPVHRGHVIAIRTVLGLQLPVAVEGVGRGATQHFDAVGRLVDDHVDDLGRFAQVLLDRDDVGIDAAEQEATIVGEGAELVHVVAAFAVEARRVAGVGRLVLDLQQLALVVEGPAVEGAGEARLVALLVPAQHCTAVRAGVGQRIELAVLAAGDDDGLATDEDGQEVVHVGDLALVCEIDPVAFEDVLHLQLEQLLVSERRAVQPVVVLLRVVLEHGLELLEIRGIVLVDLDHVGLLCAD